MVRTICWFSAGAASAVATKLTLKDTPDAVIVYCETGAEHQDNARFIRDCEHWFQKDIIRIRSEKYSSTWDVFESTRYLAGIHGARCTTELKVVPRLSWQLPSDVHVFGYTADSSDVARAKRLRETYFEMKLLTPLIERGVTKAACLDLLLRANIEIPIMYKLGFQNNNCIPCVKAQSPSYWALIRREFPAEFERMAKLSRELDVRLCKINEERRFIDEIPLEHPTTNPMAPACDFLCAIAEQDL